VGYVNPRKARKKAEKASKAEKNHQAAINGAPAISPNVMVYPNPVISGNTLNVQCRSFDSGNYLAELYSMSGQLVKSSKIIYDKTTTRLSIPTEQMLSGVYFLQLTNEKNGKRYSQQIVIN